MFLISRLCFIEVFLVYINYSTALCPYGNKLFGVLSRHDDNPSIYGSYMSTMSYNTYDTDDCYRFVPQPPPISDEVIYHALNTSIDRTMRYISLDNRNGERANNFLRNMDRSNYYFESVTKYIQATTCTSKNTTSIYLSALQLDKFDINQMTKHLTDITCDRGHIKYPKCSNELYRKIDGVCNNLKRPLDGSVGDCMQRLLPPDYKDGVNQLRTSIDGSPLPNPRVVSMKLLGQDDKRPFSIQYTEFHAFFGELVIGDNGFTLMNDLGMRTFLPSCDHEKQSRVDHPQCAGFSIPPKDVLKQIYPNQKCMPFVRSIPCAQCKLGPRMLSSSVTVAQDLNSIYGVSTSMLSSRRTMTDGCLKSEFINGHELFAIERINATERYRCFEGKCELSAFDVRNAFAATGLAFALLFHRNHNRHARMLTTIKPHWNDEEIFQEARKWNIAEYQHCLYNEYLETLIGAKLSKYFRILPKPVGELSSYEPNVLLKTIIEFQSTAGRQGHASLSEEIYSINSTKNGNNTTNGKDFKINIQQSELFESLFYDGLVDGMFLAQMSRPAFETTASVPFKTSIFDVPGRTFGLDLAALDINRQRDHGIPGYIYYLKYCHDVEVLLWNDLKQFIDSKNIKKLMQHYKYVEDVELYVGGHYERKLEDAVVGPTFACIIGIQFHNVKYGDRFFYEHEGQVSSFTVHQLNEIKKKVSLASLLCKNTHLKQVLPDPLRLTSDTNQFVSCSVYEDIDYKL